MIDTCVHETAIPRVPAGGVRRGPIAPFGAEISFLAEYGVDRAVLRAAVRRARQMAVEPLDALLASGGVSDVLFYRSVAHFIDAPFRTDNAPLHASADALRAVSDGRVRLADDTWLLAPAGASLRLLIEGARRPDRVPRAIAITTPAHLEALVLRDAGDGLARRASLALPTLQSRLSARGALDGRAASVVLAFLVAVAVVFLFAPAFLAIVAGVLFLAAIVFRWWMCAAGLHARSSSAAAPPAVPDAALPRYTILVPLYKEAGMVRDLVRNLCALDYPAEKLDIMLLVETDDAATRAALAAVSRPHRVRVVVVPPGEPRTKPRALNVGLALARGDLVTVYDAEDRPQTDQLRKAATQYVTSPAAPACLQGRLVITKARHLVSKMFALEYAVLFDLFNVGLARLGLPVALGGTSNHFSAAALRSVGGWDAWNVTEDADLGFRLARFGYATEMLASTTLEEAPVRLGVWMRQRRRWTKGWMQVALVLARDPSAVRDLGPRHALAVALMLVNLVAGPLASPVVLLLALWQTTHGGLTGSGLALASVVPAAAIASTLWSGWMALRVRHGGSLASLVPLLLPYQLLIAAAAWGGLWDLIVRPYHWRKTPHGAEGRGVNRSSPAGRRPRRRACPPSPRR